MDDLCERERCDGQLLRMAPELRRSAWYVIVGALLLMPVAVWVDGVVRQRPRANVAGLVIALGLLALGMTLPLRWAIYVSDDGVARRRLFRWDWWTWNDFSSGRLTKKDRRSFVDPERPWWRRTLKLDHLDVAAADQLVELINTQYQLPPPPTVPEELEIKIPFRKKAILKLDQIEVVDKGVHHFYSWPEVQRLRIVRADLRRRDFQQLLLTLPDRSLELKLVHHQGGVSPTWKGASAEVISEYLLARIPTERTDDSVTGARPRFREDIELALGAAVKDLRDLRIVMAICGGGLVAGLIWMGVEEGWIRSVLMGTYCSIVFIPVFAYFYRIKAKRVAQLKLWLAEGDPTGR